MSRFQLSGIAWLAFAALSGIHFLSLWRIAGYHLPALAAAFAVLLAVAWLGVQGLFLYAIRRNKLNACMMAVFLYVMIILFSGMRVLDGVPAAVGEGQWRDPDQRLAPEDKYLLHNHGSVSRALSEAEYRLYLNYVTCYFTAGFMLFAAVFCLNPLDKDRQLFHKRRVLSSILDREPRAAARRAPWPGGRPGAALRPLSPRVPARRGG